MLLTSSVGSDVTLATWHRQAKTDLPWSPDRTPMLVHHDTAHVGALALDAMRRQRSIDLGHVVWLLVHRITDVPGHVDRIGIRVHDVPGSGEFRPAAANRANEQPVAGIELQRQSGPI